MDAAGVLAGAGGDTGSHVPPSELGCELASSQASAWRAGEPEGPRFGPPRK